MTSKEYEKSPFVDESGKKHTFEEYMTAFVEKHLGDYNLEEMNVMLIDQKPVNPDSKLPTELAISIVLRHKEAGDKDEE